jgi:hypothetical protein
MMALTPPVSFSEARGDFYNVAIAHDSVAFSRLTRSDLFGHIIFGASHRPAILHRSREDVNLDGFVCATRLASDGVSRCRRRWTDDRLTVERNQARRPGIRPCSVHGRPGRICSGGRGGPAWSSPQRSQGSGQPTGDGERDIQARPERCLLSRGRPIHAWIWSVGAT